MYVIDSLRQAFRWADAVDIALVAMVIYAVIMWIKATHSRPILYGIAILTVVYLGAHRFDMYMTAGLFKAGLTVAAIAAIVVFQEDLRRAFFRFVTLGQAAAQGGRDDADSGIETVAELAFELADKRTGALIVFQGTEPLDRHLRGGTEIDASINKALLDSIFDPHSLGHDGAVVITKGRIRRFATHLPLSPNHSALRGRGTRHSAALGLSEVSDALIVVVSEERGRVSVARGGTLVAVDDQAALLGRIKDVAGHGAASGRRSALSRLINENAGAKFAAVLLACVAWLAVSFRVGTVQKTFVVPIEYPGLSENMELDDNAPTEARVTLSGHDRAFSLLAPGFLKVIVNMSAAQDGLQTIPIDESHVKTPQNLSLYRTIPRVLTFTVLEWVRQTVPVEVDVAGDLPAGLTVKPVPAELSVMVWRSRVAQIRRLATEPIKLIGVTPPAELKAKLIVPTYVRTDGESPAEITLRVEKSVPEVDQP